jgi:hypothetical protein
MLLVSLVIFTNAGVVKTFSATIGMARFRIKIIFLWRKNDLAYYNAGVVAVNLKVVPRIGSWSHLVQANAFFLFFPLKKLMLASRLRQGLSLHM